MMVFVILIVMVYFAYLAFHKMHFIREHIILVYINCTIKMLSKFNKQGIIDNLYFYFFCKMQTLYYLIKLIF